MKHPSSVQFDNIATPSHPVYRKRIRKPFTCYAVRMELVAQAAQLPEQDQQAYVNRRLTQLDRALSGDEAEALERWLDCEDLLQGRAKTVDWDGGGGGSGRPSAVPNWAMEMLQDHAEHKRHLAVHHRKVLGLLGQMMDAPQWDFGQAGIMLFGSHLGYSPAKKRFIGAVREAAAALTKLHG